MNVTGQDVANYFHVYLAELESEANKYLSREIASTLVHLSFLPSRITCYVSTQFGVAVEFQRSAATEIIASVGSARAEDLLVQAPRSLRKIGPMFSIAHSHFMRGIILTGGFPFRLISEDAHLTLYDMQFRYKGWTRGVAFAEVYGNRTAQAWTKDRAIIRAKDVILAAMVELNLARDRKIGIQEYITKFKQNTVLLLGDYDGPGAARLDEISASIVRKGYEPILVKNIPDHPHQELSAKVIAIGAVARFVVVDDSSKSGHLMEVQLCKNNDWITILLRENGKGGSWMTAGASYTSTIILEQGYTLETLDDDVAQALGWAERRIKNLERKFENTYPWRQPQSDDVR